MKGLLRGDPGGTKAGGVPVGKVSLRIRIPREAILVQREFCEHGTERNQVVF